MLYKKIFISLFPIHCFLISPTHGGNYYLSNNTQNSIICEGTDTCNIYCDSDGPHEVSFNCANVTECNFYCNALKCAWKSSMLNASLADNLFVMTSNSDECMKDTHIYTPDNGNATFIMQSSKGFKNMHVIAGAHAQNIIIKSNSTLGIGDECKDMTVDASTAQYLDVTVSNQNEIENVDIICPTHVHSDGLDNTQCFVDVTDATLAGINIIIAPYGVPYGVDIQCPDPCTEVKLQCDTIAAMKDLTTGISYPIDDCFWTEAPTIAPSQEPTFDPTIGPTSAPTVGPTAEPTADPTVMPSVEPTITPTFEPTGNPTITPTFQPTVDPTVPPTFAPTVRPTVDPTVTPTVDPTVSPTIDPTVTPTIDPTVTPTIDPTVTPTVDPTIPLTFNPTVTPTVDPTITPTVDPTITPTVQPISYTTVKSTTVSLQNTENSNVTIDSEETYTYTGVDIQQFIIDALPFFAGTSAAILFCCCLCCVLRYIERIFRRKHEDNYIIDVIEIPQVRRPQIQRADSNSLNKPKNNDERMLNDESGNVKLSITMIDVDISEDPEVRSSDDERIIDTNDVDKMMRRVPSPGETDHPKERRPLVFNENINSHSLFSAERCDRLSMPPVECSIDPLDEYAADTDSNDEDRKSDSNDEDRKSEQKHDDDHDTVIMDEYLNLKQDPQVFQRDSLYTRQISETPMGASDSFSEDTRSRSVRDKHQVISTGYKETLGESSTDHEHNSDN